MIFSEGFYQNYALALKSDLLAKGKTERKGNEKMKKRREKKKRKKEKRYYLNNFTYYIKFQSLFKIRIYLNLTGEWSWPSSYEIVYKLLNLSKVFLVGKFKTADYLFFLLNAFEHM